MIRSLPLVLLLVVACNLGAQQIPWEPSFREPYRAPQTFIGLRAQSGLSIHGASLTYLDDIYHIPCCTYEHGTGIPFSIGISTENWVLPDISVGADASVLWETASFATSPLVVPRSNGEDLRTRYEMAASTSWLTLGLHANYRLARSPWTIGFRMAGSVLLSSTMAHKEVVLGPDSYYFISDPPSKEVQLPVASISDLRGLTLQPGMQVAYDLPLTLPVYISPYLGVGTIIGSLSEQHRWGVTTVSIGVRLMHGL